MAATWELNQEKQHIIMRILSDNSLAVIIDVQERLFPHMHERESLEKNLNKLLSGLIILDLPVIFTEQYSKGLGLTIPSLTAFIRPSAIEKNSFSCCDNPAFMQSLENSGKKNVLIAGIESHVCVLQTVIDLTEKGFRPVVIEDCVTSRNPNDRIISIQRMHQEGAIISTLESILFELLRTSGTARFKEISKLVK